MAIESSDVPTRLASGRPPRQEPRTFAVPGPRPRGMARTGIVFVHGIGTQLARETLFDWAGPIIEVLAEWRREYDQDHPKATIGENPVSSASIADPANPWIEVDIPAFGDRKREQWLLTEAYWAGDVRAPSFGDAATYLIGRLPGVVDGIARGYGDREKSRRLRLRRLIREHRTSTNAQTLADVEDLRRSLDGRWRITDALDKLWQYPAVRYTLAAIATPVALTVLGIYAALHAIPIDAIRKRVDIALADRFIVDWFGDLKIILDDQAQSAVVRSRVFDRIQWLKSNGCEDVVIVAHSGGAIVSYATLLRFDDKALEVAKLVTLGEALQLGWRLEQGERPWLPGNSIRGDLKITHPNLRWVDVWATYDPAPAGPFQDGHFGCPLVAVDRLSQRPKDPKIHIESRPVTNFMHLGLDHGGYWENDEGFLIPLIRHVDDPRGDGRASRFYRNALDRTVRTERRRRRVAIMLGWRWAAAVTGIAAVLLAAWRTSLTATGDAVAGVFGLLPGHQLITGPIEGIGNAVTVIFGAIGWTAVPEALASIGPIVLGALVPVVAVLLVYNRGNGSWYAHDLLERKKIRREHFEAAGRPSARSEAVLLVGGLIAVILASLVVPMAVVVAWLVAVAIVGFAMRFVGRPETPPSST